MLAFLGLLHAAGAVEGVHVIEGGDFFRGAVVVGCWCWYWGCVGGGGCCCCCCLWWRSGGVLSPL